jgi:hypothetical protein
VQVQCKVGDSDLQRQITDQAAELRKEMKSESSRVQQQFDEIRLQLSKELGTVDKEMERVTNKIALHHPYYTGNYLFRFCFVIWERQLMNDQ